MMGLVLWADAKDSKAVFWCEDHGDLAYYDATLDGTAGGGALRAGDMVHFDVTLEDSVRRAHRPKLLGQRVTADLPSRVLESAGQSEEPCPADRVVAFPQARQQRPAPLRRRG